MKTTTLLAVATSILAIAACADEATTAAPTPSAVASAQTAPSLFDAEAIPAEFQNPILPAATGEDFLAAFAGIAGAERTDSGLVLQTLREGTGPEITPEDLVRVQFVARLAGQGEPFESTYENSGSVVFQVNDTLPGWSEALPMTRGGSLVRVALPASLAFGAQGMPGGPVGPNQVTVYDLEVVEVYPASDPGAAERLAAEANSTIDTISTGVQRVQAMAQQEYRALGLANAITSRAFLAEQEAREGVLKTESGLLYEAVTDVAEGDTPSPDNLVTVHYTGTLADGTVFDSSVQRGQPAEFQLSGVIRAWTEGLQLMNVGDKFKLYVPPALGYGEQGIPGGPIGPNQALVFDVELLGVAEAPAPAATTPSE
ncbi:MAG: FKBP-type peptidyl-prolyl cis-trans isomerase [Pseudomonadota bacterium]